MRITNRQLRRIIREVEGSTKKYDDDSALKGGQSKLPDALQKGIIDKTVEDREEREEEEREEKNESVRTTKRKLRRIIREVQRLPRKDRNQRDDEVLLDIYRAASLEGTRVVVQGEKGSLYVGIGNTEGLHGFADVLAREKWQKSGSGFVRKLKGLIPGNVIQGVEGRNRFDFGTWTPQLQAMVADLNTAEDLKALTQARWD